mmetsp:Transcript_120578/g.257514  ORF Transcript_120578/g.257514 Transcript_120578/m.257514 type:complete len:286 (-) Transcript_120578:439-1296(-)
MQPSHQGYKLQNVEDGELDDDEDAGSSQEDESGGCSFAYCACVCCVLIIAAICWTIRWNTSPGCGAVQSTIAWNTMMPPHTAMQFQHQWPWMPSKVAVYNTSEVHEGMSAEIGYWSDINVFVNRRIVYIDTLRDEAVLEARKPWGLYMGKRYGLWRCGDLPEDTFHIEQDIFGTSWIFNWDQAKAFNIAKGTRLIAKSYSRTNNHLLTSFFSEKEIEVTDLNGQTIANIQQESQLQAGFSMRRFFINNLRPDIIPNEVASFLGSVWELNGVKEKTQSDTSSRRRR